jgi:fumarate reductase flavoprotein subunit
MEEKNVHTTSRRQFLKGAGLGVLAAAASAGAFSAASPMSALASDALPANESGVTDFSDTKSMYTEVFQTPMRSIPVRDVPTDLHRQGNVAFELREFSDSEITRTEETDVLVAGAGITGSVAALSASDDGTTQVLCLEKMSEGRGMFEGMGVVGGTVMTEAGNNVDKAEAMDAMRNAAYYRVPVDPIMLWGDRSGEAADWLQEKFDEGEGGIQTYYKEGKANAHFFPSIQTEIAFKSDQWSEQTTNNAGGAGIYIVKDLTNTFSKRSNATLRYRNAVVCLERDDSGRVTGAICKDSDGYYRVNASKGVILATGGFDANPQMLEAWCRPEDITNYGSWCPNYGTTGDGQLMGLAIGAQMDPLPACVMNFDMGNEDAFYSGATGMRPFLSGIFINEKGVRFASESMPFQARSNAISAQKDFGAGCWKICGSNALASLDEASLQKSMDKFEEVKNKGWAVDADTIAELAEQMECDPDTLQASVDRFNGFVDAQKDDDFNRPMSGVSKVEGDHFYAIRYQSAILATVSGLVVDYYCHVLDYENEVIPGLFAAGGASGGFFSGNYPRHIFGPSIGRCVTFGYVAGQNAAKEA